MASLMNGLSALGQGVSQFAGAAGLDAQRADLAQKQAVLADQLATTRETTLEGQRQTFQTGLEGQRQTFQAGQTDKELAARASEGALTRSAEMARTMATINAPPETIKLLRALGVPLPGDTPPAGGSSAGAPGGTGRDYTGAPNELLGGLPNPAPDASPSAPTSATAAPGTSGTASSDQGRGAVPPPVADPMDNPIVQKALGYPAAGSEDALRRAVAADVKSDPAFKYASAGKQAVETELRVNVAKGTMTSPETQAANAAMIASYQIKPPDGFALSRPGAAETMAMVTRFNPDYQESRFPEVNKGMSAFGTGKQGDITRSLNVGVQHLALFDQAAQAIGNGNVQALNSLKNAFQAQFGIAAPTTLDGLKQIVATEIEKSVAGGIGSAADRDRLIKSLDGSKSPAQLQDMTNSFRGLMAGQLDGLRTQYVDSTGFKTGPFAFENKLGPETIKVLGAHTGGAPADAALPMPKSADDAVAGKIYNTPRGPLRWDGSQFFPVQ